MSFQAIIDEAVADYTHQIGVDPTRHDSAIWLKSCHSPTDVLKVLEDKANKFKDYRDGNRTLLDYLKPVVKVIHVFSDVLGEATSSVSRIGSYFVEFVPNLTTATRCHSNQRG
jgi:hypothetical protein